MKATTPIGSLQIGILLLAAATAIIHLALAIPSNILFYLNGLGYLGLAAGLYFVPQLANKRSLIRWVLVGFTAVTIILFFIFNAETGYGALGLVDKAIEVALIVLLWLDR